MNTGENSFLLTETVKVSSGKRFSYWNIMNTIYDHLSYLVLLCLTRSHNVISIVPEMLPVQQHAQFSFLYMSSTEIVVDVDAKRGSYFLMYYCKHEVHIYIILDVDIK